MLFSLVWEKSLPKLLTDKTKTSFVKKNDFLTSSTFSYLLETLRTSQNFICSHKVSSLLLNNKCHRKPAQTFLVIEQNITSKSNLLVTWFSITNPPQELYLHSYFLVLAVISLLQKHLEVSGVNLLCGCFARSRKCLFFIVLKKLLLKIDLKKRNAFQKS